MSTQDGTGGPDVELLADLDAGLLDADLARQLRAAASADPAATAVLDALAATRRELAGSPTPVPPPGATARWAAALESAGRTGTSQPRTTGGPPAPESEPAQSGRTADEPPIRGPLARVAGPARRPRRRPAPSARRRPAPPLIAAGLLALLIGGAALWPRAEPIRITGINLAAAGRSAVGRTDLGVLADPARRAGCLRAVAASGPGRLPDGAGDPRRDATVIGGRQVELDGRPGVLLVMPTGERGVFAVVVVDPACGPDGGTLLGATTIGR